MRSMSIGNLLCSNTHTFILILGLLLIISTYAQQKATAQTVQQVKWEDEISCALVPGSQNPVWVKDATPNKKVAVITGIIKGRDTLKKGECAGTEIGLNPHRTIITLTMNDEGEKKGEIYIPPTAAKTGSMQMVDLSTCRAGEVIEVNYVDSKPEEGCIYSFPEDDTPKIYSGPVSAAGTVFQSAPFCASTINITGNVTVTVFKDAAQVVQNLTRVFGTPGDGCFSGFTDKYQRIFLIDAEKKGGSTSAGGKEKEQNDTYSWTLTGDGQNLSGSFMNEHHYCCGNGNHTGTASGNVTLSRQKEGN